MKHDMPKRGGDDDHTRLDARQARGVRRGGCAAC